MPCSASVSGVRLEPSAVGCCGNRFLVCTQLYTAAEDVNVHSVHGTPHQSSDTASSLSGSQLTPASIANSPPLHC